MRWWSPVLGNRRAAGVAVLSLGLLSQALCAPADINAQADGHDAPEAAPVSLAALHLVSSELPPLIFARGSGSPGALGELLQDLGLELGQNLQASFYPFARAIALTRRGPGVLMAPLVRTPEREKLLRWVAMLYQNRYVLYGKRERWLQLPPEADLQAARVVVLRGAISRDRLRGLGFMHVIEEADYPRILRRLDEGTVDFVYAAEPTFLGALQSAGREPAGFLEGPSYDTREVWLAASPDVSEPQLQQIRLALDKLKRDGRYAKFLQKARLKL